MHIITIQKAIILSFFCYNAQMEEVMQEKSALVSRLNKVETRLDEAAADQKAQR